VDVSEVAGVNVMWPL